MQVRECMTREVQIASPQESICDAAKMMADCDSGVLPVSENDRLVGMITDRDIAIRGVGQGRGPNATVREVMTQDCEYCFDDEDADAVLRRMGELQLRRMPVLNREKRLVGIVSLSDLAKGGESRSAGSALTEIARPGGERSQALH